MGLVLVGSKQMLAVLVGAVLHMGWRLRVAISLVQQVLLSHQVCSEEANLVLPHRPNSQDYSSLDLSLNSEGLVEVQGLYLELVLQAVPLQMTLMQTSP
jgi:hypothetical protein